MGVRKTVTKRQTKPVSSTVLLCCLASFVFGCACAVGQEEVDYRFERMWPTLQQPWYFNFSRDIAQDDTGAIYVADGLNDRIQKFTSDGHLIVQWGRRGTYAEEFDDPWGIAVDPDGYVYVADTMNHRIQKFTSDGQFLHMWGSQGSGPSEFNEPCGIAIDQFGTVYVVDSGNHRIQKFDPDGDFVDEWGGMGSGNGQFNEPRYLAVSSDRRVYVTDAGNDRIQVFNTHGEYFGQWGGSGSGEGQFDRPQGIALDSVGNVYVVDAGNNRIQAFAPDGTPLGLPPWGGEGPGHGQFLFSNPPETAGSLVIAETGIAYVVDTYNDRIQKLTLSGDFLAAWESKGTRPGQFRLPGSLDVAGTGPVYVVDFRNDRVQRFSPDGEYQLEWGSPGAGQSEFNAARGIAVDDEGAVYVADTGNNRVQKFTAEGTYITEWGSFGRGEGQFRLPYGVAAVKSANAIYVADYMNNRIQRFMRDGTFVLEWGERGVGQGEFMLPCDVAVDSTGAVYVVDQGNDRIQKFVNDGEFVTEWGERGSAPRQFISPIAIAVDNADRVHVVDFDNDRVQTFTTDGDLLQVWGGTGSMPGQLMYPGGIAADESGALYVSDSTNHRVQKFRPITVVENSKAIVVAGGGPFPGNNLWDATQMCANFAYRTLIYQGFTSERVYYLSANTQLDLDSDGAPDVDGDATNANLQYAITEWAADADSLVLYCTDHGGNDNFRMGRTETLSVTDLDDWLDQLQDIMAGRVVAIYDACEAGSFVADLAEPARARIVIASTSPGQKAHFVVMGSVSFSNFFWTEVFNGLDLAEAYGFASVAIEDMVENQSPQLDADGDGVADEDTAAVQGVFIGTGTDLHEDRPIIGRVSDPQAIQDTNTAILKAFEVNDPDGIARVWAVIRPPAEELDSSDSAVVGLPTVDLWSSGVEYYEGSYSGFKVPGRFSIAIYARDSIGNTSLPALTTVTVVNPQRPRAIIVAGYVDPADGAYWAALQGNAALAYNALRFQGYSDDDIQLLSHDAALVGRDGDPTEQNIEDAISTWATENTQDLVVYMEGDGGNGVLALTDTETLSAGDLDTWLDDLQCATSMDVVIVYDACMAGTFLDRLLPPAGMRRIVVASADVDESARFYSEVEKAEEGAPEEVTYSFSRFFWTQVANGATVYDAFWHGKHAMAFTADEQAAQLDDDASGKFDEVRDGVLARRYRIGIGIEFGGDDPVIGDVGASPDTLDGELSATLWAEDVTTTSEIKRVWAVIRRPDYEAGPEECVPVLPMVQLERVGGGRYEGVYNDFDAVGEFSIAVYARDMDGDVSQPMQTLVTQTVIWPGTIIGFVRDGETRVPIAGAQAVLGISEERTTLTDFGGVYTFPGLDEGPYSVTVSAPGYVGDTEYVDVEWNTTTAVDFELAPVTYTLTMGVVGNGTVTPDLGAHTYREGTVVAIEAVAAEGWRFDHWVGDALFASSPVTTVTMDDDETVTAVFEDVNARTHTLRVTATEGGTVDPLGVSNVPHGSSLTVDVTPDAGGETLDVVLDGISLGPQVSFTFTEVYRDHTLHAVFRDICPPTVTYQFPAASATAVVPRPRLAFRVADTGSGVGAVALEVTAGGVSATTDFRLPTRVGPFRRNGHARHTVRSMIEGTEVRFGETDLPECWVDYVPDPPFEFEQEVTVTLNASDEAGNAMAPLTYSFTTTDGLDLNFDGVCDDWAAVYGIVSEDDLLADPDGDGRNTRQEAQMGTDPLTADSPYDYPDPYEDDDTPGEASWIGLTGARQTHNFHDDGDEDWATFFQASRETVTIETRSLGSDCDTVVELYAADGTTLIESEADSVKNGSVQGSWLARVLDPGYYYVRVRRSAVSGFGPDAFYDLLVWEETGPEAFGSLQILVSDARTGAALPDAQVSVELQMGNDLSALTSSKGVCLFTGIRAETYEVSVSAAGYRAQSEGVSVEGGGLTKEEFRLVRPNGCTGGTMTESIPRGPGIHCGDLLVLGGVAAALALAARRRNRRLSTSRL